MIGHVPLGATVQTCVTGVQRAVCKPTDLFHHLPVTFGWKSLTKPGPTRHTTDKSVCPVAGKQEQQPLVQSQRQDDAARQDEQRILLS